jgi:hypothetical protein
MWNAPPVDFHRGLVHPFDPKSYPWGTSLSQGQRGGAENRLVTEDAGTANAATYSGVYLEGGWPILSFGITLEGALPLSLRLLEGQGGTVRPPLSTDLHKKIPPSRKKREKVGGATAAS